MASKWADYIITAARFNSAGTHIEGVETYELTGTELTNRTTKSRSSVVTSNDSGYTFCTVTKGSDGRYYYYGAAIEIVTIDEEKFIKTKADSSKKDNLDNPPTF